MSNLATVWQPQPKQALFMSRWEQEAFYGGAAGGGKSDALVAEALRQVEIPYYRALIVRRTFPQLEDLIGKSLRLYPKAYPGAKYNISSHTWTFPSGATIQFQSMPHADSYYNFQGRPWDYIALDELTQFTFEQYDYLVHSRNRPNGPGTRVYARFTGNPGGVGHGWVKETFVTAAKPGTTHWEPAEVRFPDGHVETKWSSRIFIPASVFDNRKLLDNDPDYLARMASMPEATRNALLYGDWDTFAGQVFAEWRNDPAHYADRKGSHVIDPFIVPSSWAIYRGFDWGYSRPFSVGWYAVDHDRRIYRIRELYGCKKGQPNTGVQWEAGKVAKAIKEIEAQDPNLKGKRIRGIADPAIFADAAGTGSIADTMERYGIYWDPGQHERINGKMQVHHHLAMDTKGIPHFYCFTNCPQFIRTLPNLVYDELDVEDVDTDGEDHIYDEFRYVCMENPCAPPPRQIQTPKIYDPLSADPTTEYGSYAYAYYRK